MEQNASITGDPVPADPSTTGAGMGQAVSSSSSSDTMTTSTWTAIATGIIGTTAIGSQTDVSIPKTALGNPSATETEPETLLPSSSSTTTTATTTTTSTSTTEIPMIAALFPNQEILSDLAGSVSTVTAGETIIVLDCLAGITSPCGGLADPITLTTGPSTFDYTAVYESATDGAEIVGCEITPLSGIDCTTRYTEAGGLSDNAATSTTNELSSQAGGISYETITITGGVDLLPIETYITTDYGWIIAYTGTATPTREPDSGSASKAWIAGPVIGGIVGVLLIVGAIWFWMRRRKAKKGRKAGGDPTGDMAELEGGGLKVKDFSKLDVNKSELPVREHATAELSAEERREGGMVYELPP
ncbi:hypothetical protein BJY01DRAFT_253676 [Aspergillus pseudoustus]|uniref:Mid2 domain-containing protein n=1 Tax=Aspergillus pseudoustus TaxID=1810923 RepID=A0ABR4IZ52_9EURO